MTQEVSSSYVAVVQALAMRVHIAEDALNQVRNLGGSPLSIGACEIATLQLRLICELLLAGSQLAHIEDAGAEISDDEWRPKQAFAQLKALSEHPLQIPIEIIRDAHGEGSHQIKPVSKPIPFDLLSRIYGKCGDLLHVPTIRQMRKGKLPEFDVDQLSRWASGFKRLAQGHVLMLPERKIVFLCNWVGQFGVEPELLRLDAAGQSTLDLDEFPEFTLLLP